MYPIVRMSNKRHGFQRSIVNEAPGVYRWSIEKDGQLSSSNTEPTFEDALRVVRSTTRFLHERG